MSQPNSQPKSALERYQAKAEKAQEAFFKVLLANNFKLVSSNLRAYLHSNKILTAVFLHTRLVVRLGWHDGRMEHRAFLATPELLASSLPRFIEKSSKVAS
jgi:hypothetical protein